MGIFSDYLLVSDFDLTLTNAEDRVPEANLRALAYFMEQGGAFTVATGRSLPMAWGRLRDFPRNAPLITFNGAMCSEPATGEIYWSQPLPDDFPALLRPIQESHPDTCLELQTPAGHYTFHDDADRDRYLAQQQVPIFPGDWESLDGPIYKASFYTPGKRLFAVEYGSDTAKAFEVLAQDIRKAGEGRYDAVNSRPGMVEIQSAACSKGKSARRLAKLLGRRILVCVGDSQNDLSMLREADLPFLTGDGDPALAALGIPQVCPCGEGAVAGVIEQLALREKKAHI